MISPHLELLRSRLDPLRSSLIQHRVYSRINSIGSLRVFMEHHVFAVWDFMSLLKALQRRLTCVDVPWLPPVDPASCRLVNEIVLGEESDEDGDGNHSSHFELYRDAMLECGANTQPIDGFIASLRNGVDLTTAMATQRIPAAVSQFVNQTFEIIRGGDVCAIAAAFTFGREDLLPDVFRQFVHQSSVTNGTELKLFRYYLDRHIEVDGGEHGPMAWKLLERLCGEESVRWSVAEKAATQSLVARARLWAGVCDRLDEQPHAAE